LIERGFKNIGDSVDFDMIFFPFKKAKMLIEVGREWQGGWNWTSNSLTYYGIMLMSAIQSTVVHTEEEAKEIAFQIHLEKKRC